MSYDINVTNSSIPQIQQSNNEISSSGIQISSQTSSSTAKITESNAHSISQEHEVKARNVEPGIKADSTPSKLKQIFNKIHDFFHKIKSLFVKNTIIQESISKAENLTQNNPNNPSIAKEALSIVSNAINNTTVNTSEDETLKKQIENLQNQIAKLKKELQNAQANSNTVASSKLSIIDQINGSSEELFIDKSIISILGKKYLNKIHLQTIHL